MTYKKFRVKKEHIYEDANLKNDNVLCQTAALFGYTFAKIKNNYYMLSIKRYKTKPDCLTCEIVDLEIVEDNNLSEVKHE